MSKTKQVRLTFTVEAPPEADAEAMQHSALLALRKLFWEARVEAAGRGVNGE